MTTTSDDAATHLVDTSAAVALLLASHEHHDATFEAVAARRLGLAGHAAFETFSVLTRLPPPNRRSGATVARLLQQNFPDSRFLSRAATAALLTTLARGGIVGGSVYDALVGAAAAQHGLPLVSRDHRAAASYRALGVHVELLD